MKTKIVVITVCLVLCLALLPLSSFTVSAASSSNTFVPDYVTDLGGYVTPVITSSMGSWFGSDWNYTFTPDMYLKYTLRTDSTTTQRTTFRILYEDVLSNVSADDLIEVTVSFASFVAPLNTSMSIIDSTGSSKDASFEFTTTSNTSDNGEACNTYNFTALINDFSGLVGPYDISILLDVPYVYVPYTTVYTGDCYIPFTDLRITFNDISGGGSGGDTSGGDTSGSDTSGGGSAENTSGYDCSCPEIVFPEINTFPEKNEYGFYFGVPYTIFFTDNGLFYQSVSIVFYDNGSCLFYDYLSLQLEIDPFGSCTYLDKQIFIDGVPFGTFSDDGLVLTLLSDEIMYLDDTFSSFDFNLFFFLSELLDSVESLNETIVSLNNNLTNAPPALTDKINDALSDIEAERDKQEQIQNGLNDLEFPDENEQQEILTKFGTIFENFNGFSDIGSSDGSTLREVWSAIWSWEYCVSALGIVASMIVIHKIMFG